MSNSSLLNHKIHRQEILQMGYGQFLRNHTFVNHQKIHFKEKTHKCNECGIASRNNSVLLSIDFIILVRNSTNIKIVGKRLLRIQALLVMWKYIVERRLKCNECVKTFRDNSMFLEHWRIHTGEKPYPCNEYGKSFRKIPRLINHQSMQTGEKLSL